MRYSLLTYVVLLIGLISCEQEAPDQNAVARVNDKYLSEYRIR